jgi:hypothetical protein
VRAALAVAALVAVFAGCGGGGGGEAPPQSLPGASDQILKKADVTRYPADSPERALLQWWRDTQHANFAGYATAFAVPVRKRIQTDRRAQDALNFFAGSIRAARPRVENVERDGPQATVYTDVEYRTPVGATRFVTTTRPQAFVLVRQQGTWRLRDDYFVQVSLPPTLRRAG